MKQFTLQIRKAIPNLIVHRIVILSVTKDVITWQRFLQGTHKVKMKGIPASNKDTKWYEKVDSRFESGKIVEEWNSSDLGSK
ncbi:MAG: ester cyclase [Saprospiraceae bacterium]